MAWAVKYRSEFKDLQGVDWKIDIEEDAFGGGITTLTGSGEPLKFIIDNQGDNPFEPIKESSIELQVFADTNFALADLYATDDMHFRVQIYQNTVLYWLGYSFTGEFTEPYEEFPYVVTFTAVCGLKLLRNILYYDEYLAEYYNGRIRESQIFLDILDKIGHTGFSEYVNVYEDRMNMAVGDSSIDQILIDVDIFRDMYCDEVLFHLLSKYNACIVHKAGTFVLYRPKELIGATVYGRVFTGATTKSATSFTPIQYINRSTNPSNLIQVPGGVVMIQSPIKKVTVIQDYGNKESWIDNWEFKGETFTDMFSNWTKSSVNALPALMNLFIPGESSGVFLAGKNTYFTLTDYIYQDFGVYAITSADDRVVLEFDYLIYNKNATIINNFIIYIQVTNGTHYLRIVNDNEDDKFAWDTSTGTTEIRIECDGVLPGSSDWVHYKRYVDGIPKTADYTIKIFCTDNSGDFSQMYPAFKNFKFYTLNTDSIIELMEMEVIKFRSGWLGQFVRQGSGFFFPKRAVLKDTKTILVKEYNAVNAINGIEVVLNYILGDVVNSGIDNVLEQFAGSLAMTVTQSLEQAAGDFAADHAADYLTGGVILTFTQLSDGDVDIYFTAQTAGTAFTGATSIANVTGDLDGHFDAGKQVANRSLLPRIDTVNIALDSTGGSANITVGGVTRLCSWDTDPGQSQITFGSNAGNIAAYSAVGIDLTADASLITFTAQTPGTDFSPVTMVTIVNVSGDMHGTGVTAQDNGTATTAQVAVITLSGSSGTANITCDGVTQGIAITTITGNTVSWSTRGGAEIQPLLEIIGDEIANESSRPKQLIQMPILNIGTGISDVNILGNFQDDLNDFSGNRKFVFNRGNFDAKQRLWEIDLIEII